MELRPNGRFGEFVIGNGGVMSRKTVVITAVLSIFIATIAMAADKPGTRNEAIALVNKAASMLKDAGAEKLISTVNAGEQGFRDRDLYLFVIGPDQKVVAHAYDQGRIGLVASELYDGDGQPYGKLILKLADDKGQWVQYRIHNPVTGKVAPKSTFVRRVGDYILGCGVYE